MDDRSRTISPAEADEPPDKPDPAPLVTTGIPFEDAYWSVATTSSMLVARTTASGKDSGM
jgi:hypothetical protein